MIKYWELLSTSVSVKEVYITSFQGRLLEYDGGVGGRLLKKARATQGTYWIQGANSNFYGSQKCLSQRHSHPVGPGLEIL